MYVVVFGSIAFLIGHKHTPQVNIPVASYDLPAYHLVVSQDLRVVAQVAATVLPDVLTDEQQIIGTYTLQAVAKDSAISREKVKALPSPALLANTTAIGLPATEAMVLGGNLRSGDVVDITAISAVNGAPSSLKPDGTQPAKSMRTFEKLLVLDVKPTTSTSPAAVNVPPTHPFVIVIALPTTSQSDFLAHSAGADFLVTRRP